MPDLRACLSVIASLGIPAGGCSLVFPFEPDEVEEPDACDPPAVDSFVAAASAVALAGPTRLVVGEWANGLAVYPVPLTGLGDCGRVDLAVPEDVGGDAWISGIAAQRGTIYAAQRLVGVAVMDAPDPCAPQEASSLPELDVRAVLARTDGVMVAAGRDGVVQWTFEDTEWARYQIAPPPDRAEPETLAATPTFTLAGTGSFGKIHILGPNPGPLSFPVAQDVRDVAWMSNPPTIVVAAELDGLVIVDGSLLPELGDIATFSTSGPFAASVAVDGHFVFVCGGPHEGSSTDGERGFLDAVDLSDLLRPRRLWTVELPETCWDVTVGDQTVFVADDGHVVSVDRGCAR